MRYKIFGRHTGLKISELALGTGRLGQTTSGETDPAEARRVLEGFAEAGGNLIDTSDAYLGGEAEKIIGEFIAPNRDDFVVASKFGRTAGRNAALGVLGNTRKAMASAVEASLKRLRTDHLDLYFTHFNDAVTPVEEIVRGFEDLARAGKILYAGLSNFPAWRVAVGATLASERGWVPVAAMEVEYNLLQRTTERELLPMADGLGLGALGYSPLAGGLLTGKRGPDADAQPAGGKDHGDLGRAQQDQVIDAVVSMAREIGTDAGKVATAWVAAKGVVPILGARTRAQLDDNLGVAAVRLNAEQISKLDAVSAVPRGYPHELTASKGAREGGTGNRWDQIDFPTQTVV